jgi:peptidoglycan/xylan/chitin deacetylase (PgdA/CDA1 family)
LAAVGASLLGLALLAGFVDHDASSTEGEPPPARTGCTPGVDGLATRGEAAGRRVALTFDDGPSAYTPRVLRALRRHQAHATFFVIGSQIEGREGLLRRIVRDGHEIGNHSMLHTPGPSTADLADANRLIEDVTGFRPCHFRPPQGRLDDALMMRAGDLGMTAVLWSIDTGDWASQDPGAILSGVLSLVEPGSIVLLHDGGGDRSGTAAIASELIDELTERDYELVTVTDLLGGEFTNEPSSG